MKTNIRTFVVQILLVTISIELQCLYSFAQSPGHNDWYWDSGANLFVGNHHGGNKEWTVEELTKVLKEIPVTAVYFLSHNNEGQNAHYSSSLLPNPKGWDMTGVWKQACENSGKRFCVYVNSLGLRLNDHVDWIRRKADGEAHKQVNPWGSGNRMCVKRSQDGTGFLEQYFLPLVDELVTRYKPDGIWVDGDWSIWSDICWCDNCKEAWKMKTGKTTVPTSPIDPDWPEWQKLHYERCDEYLETVANAVHAAHPECAYTTNNSWRINHEDPRSAPSFAGILSKDISFWNASRKTRLLSMSLSSEQETPHDIMHVINVPDKISLPKILQEGGLTMAAGSAWHLWTNNVEPGNDFAIERLKICSEFVEARRNAVGKTASGNSIAVLSSETSSQLKRLEAKQNSFAVRKIEDTALGFQDAGFGVDIVNEHILRSTDHHYRAVVIPSGQREISPQTVKSLRAFVKEGGLLLVMGSSLQGNESSIDSLLGLERAGEASNTTVKIGKKAVSFDVAGDVAIDKAKVLASDTSGNPFLTTRRFGKGRVVYVNAHAAHSYPASNDTIAWMMGKLNLEPKIRVEYGDDDKHLLYSLRSKTGSLFLHATNLTTHIDGQRVEPNTGTDIDPVAIIPQLNLKLDLPSKPKSVSVQPATSGVEYEWKDGELELKLTNIDYHAVVEMAIDDY